MPHQADLRLAFPARVRHAAHAALLPETMAEPARRSEVPKTRAEIAQEGDVLRITLEADDLPALRAAVNSYLRWAEAAARAARLAG